MNANETKQAFGELAALALKAMDAESAKTKKARAQFSRHGGTEYDDADEALKAEIIAKGLIIAQGFLVNIARIADALEGSKGAETLFGRPREKL